MMSASSSIDAYDAQMLDFSSDPDVPMSITGTAEFFAEALMDHDGQLAASAYSELASVEVDMEEYVGDNAEYEMADETAEYRRLHGDELLDVEVYDASHAPSPHIPPRPLQPSVDVPINSELPTTTSPALSERATPPRLQSEPQPEVHPATASLDRPAADVSHVEPSASGEAVSLEAVVSELAHSSDAPDDSVPPASELHEHLGDTARTSGQLLEAPASVVTDHEAEPHVPPVVEERAANPDVVQHEDSEPPTSDSTPLEDGHVTGAPAQGEKATDQVPATGEGTADPLHISDGVYIDPPPAVLLSVARLSEPGFALFNLPDVESDSAEESPGNQKAYLLLLENRPTLYYEPLNSVFEALRQDEGLLSCVPHSFEGELVLDAYDLQLAISEDDVHSREISLHDLNILHDGSDFAGPLRLFLRAIVPRFIIRYYALQEQIQRLHVAAESGEGEHYEEHHEHDTAGEQPLPRQEEVADRPSTRASVVAEGLEAPPTRKAEEFADEPVLPPESTEEVPQVNYEAGDTSAAQEPSAEYHEVAGEATHTLEDETDYEGISVGAEYEAAIFGSLDADQIHDTVAEDTDAPATATEQSEFGGEQTEYLDYVQPEEYDEGYSEELLERAGGASPVQYGEPPHYEGVQDISTAVDETRTDLPGLDEEEEDRSAATSATPVPARRVLEPESNEPADVNATNEPVSSKQENSTPSGEELATSESKYELDHTVQASGNQEPSTAQARIFSEVDESDSNFVSLLEREADAEFDRTFNAEQSGQEGSIEATLQRDETWDEWNDEDAEGDDEEDWIDPDADSNESSITLSSKASKRSYDEIDPSEEPFVENPQNSPGPKRLRAQ